MTKKARDQIKYGGLVIDYLYTSRVNIDKVMGGIEFWQEKPDPDEPNAFRLRWKTVVYQRKGQ